MATTYLELTNEILRELNEVPVTSQLFNEARGIQVHVKNSINRAYLDIVNAEPQWPFLSVASSGDVDPMYGNVAVSTTEGQRWYNLKTDSTDIKDDYGSIDWDNFYLTTVGVTGETAPYVGANLRFTTTEDWKNHLRVSENLDDADGQTYGEPNRIIRSPDSRKFGLSPIPDKEYKVWFFAYNQPTQLVNPDDTLVFPDTYASVISARARYYVWQFKDSPQAAAFALDDYKKGLDRMRSNLIEPVPSYFTDDRVRFI
jgi:hypothetical protein